MTFDTYQTHHRTPLRVKKARTFFQRARGLLGTSRFPRGIDGLYFERCRAVHTIGMRYNIDVVFLDRELTILKTCCDVAPNRAVVSERHAYGVVELPAWGARTFLAGQKLSFVYESR